MISVLLSHLEITGLSVLKNLDKVEKIALNIDGAILLLNRSETLKPKQKVFIICKRETVFSYI
jgi:hypothetical protein